MGSLFGEFDGLFIMGWVAKKWAHIIYHLPALCPEESLVFTVVSLFGKQLIIFALMIWDDLSFEELLAK